MFSSTASKSAILWQFVQSVHCAVIKFYCNIACWYLFRSAFFALGRFTKCALSTNCIAMQSGESQSVVPSTNAPSTTDWVVKCRSSRASMNRRQSNKWKVGEKYKFRNIWGEIQIRGDFGRENRNTETSPH